MSFFSKVFDKDENNIENANEVPNKHKSHVRSLIPLNELTEEGFQKALSIANFKTVSSRESLFHLGDADDKSIYLIEGIVELTSEDNKKKKISSNQASAFYPLSNLKPRRFHANAIGKVSVLEFSTEELERVVHWDHVTLMEKSMEIEVHDASESESDLSWVFHMTNSPAMSNFPASNIALLFDAFMPIRVSNGQNIIKQGDKGDYFYVIAEGSCDVFIETSAGNAEKVNSLGEGDIFGEEALLSDLPRNASVSMTSDGLLMCLSKEDFNSLLKEKILNWVKPSDISKKDYIYLDVRTESEFNRDGLKDSINIPLQELRHKSKDLEKDNKYLVYCNNGSRSSSAAYLLAEIGFDVSIIKGGLTALSEKDDHRLSKSPIPDNLNEILTQEQMLSIRKIENYGGSLWFVRRPLFGDVMPIVRFTKNKEAQTAIVEADGSLNRNHGLDIRDN